MSYQFANLQEYISGLPGNVIQNIYGHPASCLAIFRFVLITYMSFDILPYLSLSIVIYQYLQEQ